METTAKEMHDSLVRIAELLGEAPRHGAITDSSHLAAIQRAFEIANLYRTDTYWNGL